MLLSGIWGIIVALCTIGGVAFFLVGRDVGLMIPSLVLFLMVTALSRTITYACVAGAILDSYALTGLYFHTFRFLFLVLVGFFISRQWLTNRSLYTGLVLGAMLTTLDQIWIALAEVFQGNGGSFFALMRTLGTAYLVHALLILIGFTALAFFSKRLSSPIGRGGPSDWYV